MARGKPTQSYHGKVVDTWIYEHSAVVETDGAEVSDEFETGSKTVDKKVEIDLRIHKVFGNAKKPPFDTKDVYFTVVCKELGFELRGTDIAALRVAMWDKLDAKFKTTWENYYLVTLERSYSSWKGPGTGMSYTYESVHKGTAWDGTQILRRMKNHDWVISPWPGTFTDQAGRVIACIKADDSNTEALENFGKQIDEMRKRIAGFLAPENIMQTLASLGGSDITAMLAHEKDPKGES